VQSTLVRIFERQKKIINISMQGCNWLIFLGEGEKWS